MSTFEELWAKFAESKKYREEFVAAQVKRGIPFQIRALLKRQHLSQDELAERAGLSQGVVSRAANLNYGNLTLNTIIRVAAGFDVAFVGKFVPFSELGRWFCELSEDVKIPTFDEERSQRDKSAPDALSQQLEASGLEEIRAQTRRESQGLPRMPVGRARCGREQPVSVRSGPSRVQHGPMEMARSATNL